MTSKSRQFISGIFNYCDRWCERCEYTARCRLFSDEQKAMRRRRRKGQETQGMEAAIEETARNFRKMAKALQREAKKRGWDLSAEPSQETAHALRQQHDAGEKHPLVVQAKGFSDAGMDLAEKLADTFNLDADDVNQRAAFMDVRGEADRMERFRDAIDTLMHDSPLVYVKMRRVADGLLAQDDPTTDEMDREFQLEDAAGTGQIVLKCLRRDKQALLLICEQAEHHQSAALRLLAKVDKLLKALPKALPGALTFVWPPTQTEPAR